MFAGANFQQQQKTKKKLYIYRNATISKERNTLSSRCVEKTNMEMCARKKELWCLVCGLPESSRLIVSARVFFVRAAFVSLLFKSFTTRACCEFRKRACCLLPLANHDHAEPRAGGLVFGFAVRIMRFTCSEAKVV